MRTWPIPFALALAVSMIADLPAADSSAHAAASSPKARISRATAQRTALSSVSGGHITQGELEVENGLKVWSFDIARPNTKVITEIQVDANTGKVVSMTFVAPKAESADGAKSNHKK